MTPWVFLVLSYLLGSVPSSYIAGRLLRGVDLREHGSGNLGATNAFRVLGAGVAAPVMLFDVLKGVVPAAMLPGIAGVPTLSWTLAFGAAAIAGHVFSVFVGLRGGKGVATAAGVFLALAPIAVLIGFIVWLAVLWASRMVSLASLTAAISMSVIIAVTDDRPAVLALGFVVAAFIVFAHRANIGRIIRGEEYRFGARR
jgi:glycerol-3-phosphate acyltransferase PlsY